MKRSFCSSFSSKTTKLLAAMLAREVLRTRPEKRAVVIALEGELGAGKTTFVQGFIKACGISSRVTSPTFLIMRKFQIPNSRFQILFHIDAYRLNNSGELPALGFREILSDPQNIVLIEWADKIKKIIPKNAVWIKFGHGAKSDERIISVK
ncbi:tRNA (adenosine(37)-N6)-threonylcarbamoyltransferase complex ATPase subunit type 1 TsaE [Candidatus Wolfebacteria bacterium RIFCSPLOWO2_01_FULL_45_19]|uniref:tRNA threonylcarbamoyladenosine biosynthesis protein TsaE n=1 Tax=Candidatus Wolfebacteria bacterium RIFCSPLOWO2_01_FULL_45_19 TaxID=1802557 RepID=A0A1F8DS68_9BACT|nr:MAG: hypothetical protein UX23_C0012G0022 [Parcubacteria group bacterium GW2011_GWB1_45_9]OGM91444.1 MAG: tRNA (adenosine(37)-N6)-threonylcarbamoyltransferase complex ATPase subunit type 1 TsaE [Candidatus Wolfebacteria bacterium RIFCSPLOWO2_01_FULL_45_19]